MNEAHVSTEHIIDYLHGELSAAEDAAIHAHLSECAACEERHSEELALTEVLRAHARARERELPPGVVAKIHAAIEQRPTSIWDGLRSVYRPYYLPAAAAIAVALYFGFSSQRTHRTAINPAYYVDAHTAVAASAPFGEVAPLPAALASNDEAR
jgi:anti-sigma factor RsiW